MPAVSDCRCVHIAPRRIGNSYGLKWIDIIYLAGGNTFVIVIDCSLDESSTIVSLKASDDALAECEQ